MEDEGDREDLDHSKLCVYRARERERERVSTLYSQVFVCNMYLDEKNKVPSLSQMW